MLSYSVDQHLFSTQCCKRMLPTICPLLPVQGTLQGPASLDLAGCCCANTAPSHIGAPLPPVPHTLVHPCLQYLTHWCTPASSTSHTGAPLPPVPQMLHMLTCTMVRWHARPEQFHLLHRYPDACVLTPPHTAPRTACTHHTPPLPPPCPPRASPTHLTPTPHAPQRELATQLRRDIKPQLDQQGIKLFLVAIGTHQRSKDFIAATGFPAECLLADPDSSAYEALGLVKGVAQTFFDINVGDSAFL
jgi:hypothetical protein